MSKISDFELFFDFIFKIICNGNHRKFIYLRDWMAHAVQKPNESGGVALVLLGEPSTGKTFFAKHFGRLFREEYLFCNEKILKGFNSQLLGKSFVHLNVPSNFDLNNLRLFNICLYDSITIEKMGEEDIEVKNKIKLIIDTDYPNFELRKNNLFFVLNVGEGCSAKSKSYFDEIAKQLEEGGYEALYEYLLNYDITGFDVYNIPKF